MNLLQWRFWRKYAKATRKKYPLVQIALHTGTADVIYEMMSKGLVDIGVFLEPVDTAGFDYIRMQDSDQWVVAMRPDDPLATKEYIRKEELVSFRLYYRNV